MTIINLSAAAPKVKHNYRNNSYNTVGKDGLTSIQRAESIVRAEGGEWHGGYGSISAPGHSKKDRSVTVRPHDSNPDDVYIHCFAEDDALEIKDQLRAKGLLPQWEPNRSASNGHFKPDNSRKPDAPEKPVVFNDGWLTKDGYQLKATYTYFCPEGDCQCLRYERISAEGKKDKTFQWRHEGVDGQWYSKQGDSRPTLYRLKDLKRSTTDIVWIVEGEKDADNLAERGLVAVSIHKWSDECGKLFAGRDVVILPDNDEPGKKKADVDKNRIVGLANSVKVLALPGLPEKSDVSDWLEQGHTVEELKTLAEETPIEKIEVPGLEFDENISFESIMSGMGNPLIKNVLYPGQLGVLYGPYGAGKTFAALHLAHCIARGESFAGKKTRQAPVLYVGLEGQAGTRKRLLALKEEFGAAGKYLANITQHVSLSKGKDGDLGTKQIIEAAKQHSVIAGEKVELIIIDTLARAMAGDDENAQSDMSAFVEKRAGEIQRKTGAAVLIVHHTGLDKKRMRGSTVLGAAADIVLRIDVDGKKPNWNAPRNLVLEKSKDGEDGVNLFSFALKKIVLGTDGDGDEVTSCVLKPSKGGKKDSEIRLSTQQKNALNSLHQVVNRKGKRVPPGHHSIPEKALTVTLDDWKQECISKGVINSDGNRVIASSFRRLRNGLAAKQVIGIADELVWPVQEDFWANETEQARTGSPSFASKGGEQDNLVRNGSPASQGQETTEKVDLGDAEPRTDDGFSPVGGNPRFGGSTQSTKPKSDGFDLDDLEEELLF